jgi:hypothetical protein
MWYLQCSVMLKPAAAAARPAFNDCNRINNFSVAFLQMVVVQGLVISSHDSYRISPIAWEFLMPLCMLLQVLSTNTNFAKTVIGTPYYLSPGDPRCSYVVALSYSCLC